MTPGLVIGMTVNNRPGYLRAVLETWSRARGVEDALFVFACEPGCAEAVEVCHEFTAARRMVVKNDHRYGVLSNAHRTLEITFGFGQDFAVLAEEDVIVSTDTIELLTWARDEYRPQDGVLAVSMHSERQSADLTAVSRLRKFNGWVWGTWRDRWDCIGPDWDHDYRHRGWDHRLTDYWCGEAGLTVVTPDVSRAQHIGREGGTHCTPGMFESLLAPSFQLEALPRRYVEYPAR